MQDEQNLERVRLTFEKFSIPMISEPASFVSCEDGYLKVYMKGQEEEHHYEEHDYEFCGRSTPPIVKTEGPRLVLLFKAGAKPGSGFKANFKFETEYLVPIGKQYFLDTSCTTDMLKNFGSLGQFYQIFFPHLSFCGLHLYLFSVF